MEGQEAFLDYVADRLLLVKAYLRIDKIQNARDLLVEIAPQVTMKFENEEKRLAEIKLRETFREKDKIKEFVEKNKNPRKKSVINIEFKKVTNLLATIGALFYAVGDFKNCELMYVKYVKFIETNFGSDHLQTSNCYFLMGVFYLENKFHTKSIACFKKSLSIRVQQLGEMNESVADCWYNIGIIYKQINKKFKAIQFLEKALNLRRELIGYNSLPVAQAMESLGKLFLESGDYKACLNKFQESYAIRKKILTNSKHPDLMRIQFLIMYLQDLIQEAIAKNANNAQIQNTFLNLNDQIEIIQQENQFAPYYQDQNSSKLTEEQKHLFQHKNWNKLFMNKFSELQELNDNEEEDSSSEDESESNGDSNDSKLKLPEPKNKHLQKQKTLSESNKKTPTAFQQKSNVNYYSLLHKFMFNNDEFMKSLSLKQLENFVRFRANYNSEQMKNLKSDQIPGIINSPFVESLSPEQKQKFMLPIISYVEKQKSTGKQIN